MKNGIDVSEHQGKIDWDKVKPKIDFAIIRLGYGKNTLDKYAERNISEVNRLGIPYGVYWFSYAYTVDMAKNEAKNAMKHLQKLNGNLSYPIYFDWEYASRDYAIKNGVSVSNDLLRSMATAFCEEIEKAGYYAGIYTNLDYIKSYYGEDIFKRFDLWLAQYANKAYRDVNIWQYTDKGKVAGISGNVDMNRCYADYPAIIKGEGKHTTENKEPEKTVSDLAKEVIEGKWGAGEERKKLLGDKYDAVQAEVNRMLSGKKTVNEIAKEVIRGKWGVGSNRRRRLTAAGYDYFAVQKEVNRMLK